MKYTKHLLGIVAFVLTFGLSTASVGLLFGFPKIPQAENSGAIAKRIEKLLKRDLRNGMLRKEVQSAAYQAWVENRSTDVKDGLHTMQAFRDAINRYFQASSTIDDSDLPRDFQRAWRTHMKAWKKQADFRFEDFVLDGKTGYTAELAKLNKRYSCNVREINRTWYQVLRVAQRYGVKIDHSYLK